MWANIQSRTKGIETLSFLALCLTKDLSFDVNYNNFGSAFDPIWATNDLHIRRPTDSYPLRFTIRMTPFSHFRVSKTQSFETYDWDPQKISLARASRALASFIYFAFFFFIIKFRPSQSPNGVLHVHCSHTQTTPLKQAFCTDIKKSPLHQWF